MSSKPRLFVGFNFHQIHSFTYLSPRTCPSMVECIDNGSKGSYFRKEFGCLKISSVMPLWFRVHSKLCAETFWHRLHPTYVCENFSRYKTLVSRLHSVDLYIRMISMSGLIVQFYRIGSIRLWPQPRSYGLIQVRSVRPLLFILWSVVNWPLQIHGIYRLSVIKNLLFSLI